MGNVKHPDPLRLKRHTNPGMKCCPPQILQGTARAEICTPARSCEERSDRTERETPSRASRLSSAAKTDPAKTCTEYAGCLQTRTRTKCTRQTGIAADSFAVEEFVAATRHPEAGNFHPTSYGPAVQSQGNQHDL